MADCGTPCFRPTTRPIAAERSQAEQARLQTEVFYHSLVETIPQMILCKDLDGRFTFANDKFCAELGTTLENFKGKTDFDFFPKELAEKYRRDDKQVLESGQVLDVVEEHVTPKGEKLYVQVMKTPLRGPDGKAIGIQGIFWDVTERMRAEEKLKEQNVILHERERSEREAHQALKAAQSRMVETEKLASLGQLVAGVAHEINNPLAFVSNNVAVLERDLRDIVTLIGLYRQLERQRRSEPCRIERPDRRGQPAARPRLYAGQHAAADRANPRRPAPDRADRERPPALRQGRRGGMERGRLEPRDRVIGEHGPGIRPQEGCSPGYRARAGAAASMSRGQDSPGRRQSAHERHRRLRRRRHGHDPHAGRARGPGSSDRGRRHRLRHGAGDPRADLRSVLHHQGHRRGNRAGPFDQLRDRPGAPRDDRRPVDSGRRILLHDPAATASRADLTTAARWPRRSVGSNDAEES